MAYIGCLILGFALGFVAALVLNAKKPAFTDKLSAEAAHELDKHLKP